MVVDGLLREQIDLLGLDVDDGEFAGRVAAAARVASNALRFDGKAEAAARIELIGVRALADRTAEPLRAVIATLLQAGSPASAGPVRERPDKPPIERPTEVAERSTPRILRVEQEKVDALMNLVGELVVAKNSLPFLARRADQQYGLRELSREIKDQYGVIDRIAQELQGAVMSVRMMPVGQVFQRFPRLGPRPGPQVGQAGQPRHPR